MLTRVVSDPKSVVTPTCSLPPTFKYGKFVSSGEEINALCYGQQIISVDALVLCVFFIGADAT